MKPLKRFGIIAKHTVLEKNKKCLEQLVTTLRKNKAEIVFDEVTGPHFGEKGLPRSQVLDKCEVAISLGGDGTLLKTARCMCENPPLILGVNMGNVGFLTAISPKELPKALTHMFKGTYELDERDILRVTIYRSGKKIHTTMALNEAVINQGGFARIISLDTLVNDRKLTTYRADGLIIATPTGSTGHSLSAGGPIIHPKVPCIIIAPICPVKLGVRPIVIPADRVITIKLENSWREEKKPVVLTVDGQETFNLHKGDTVKIRTSSRKMKMIRFKGHNYYKMLRKKLAWGE